MDFPNLFSSITINGMELKNRIVMTAMHLGYTPEGIVTDRLVDFYVTRAKGGVGLIIVGGCSIDEQGSMPGMIGIDDERYIPGLKRLVKAVHNGGAKIAAQLYHAGRYIPSSRIGGEKPVSASDVRSKFTGEIPRALEEEEIPRIQDKFARAAIRAAKSGFDGVEILGSAGYLISQFLSPLTNKRDDKYGGTFENRMRFGLETVEKVRNTIGDDYPVIFRLAGNDFMKGGNTNKEARAFAVELEKRGVDLFDVTGGWHETRIPQLTMSVPEGAYVYLARGVKSSVTVPVLASNRINDPLTGEKILRNEEADMVTMARALIADPELPDKAAKGRGDLIYHCIGCNQGCFDNVLKERPVTCMVNPRAGIERETRVTPAAEIKRILVVGGGPGGMKAACVAAQRGHRVTLVEKNEFLGGQLLLNKAVPVRSELCRAASDLGNNLRDSGVKVLTGRKADAGLIEEIGPDAVILATGAKPLIPGIKGIDGRNVITAWELLSSGKKTGEKVVIVGGNAVGLTTGIYLAGQGTLSPEALHFLVSNGAETWKTLESLVSEGNKDVTVVEMLSKCGKDIGVSTRWTILKELKRLGVKVITGARAVEVMGEGLEIEKEGNRHVISADSIVIATGALPERGLEKDIEPLVRELHVIGDAEEPRKAIDAVREGFFAGLKV